MKTVAIINQKGGVGKTTTSINLAVGLVERGQRVLLVDLDPQAHSTIGLGVEPGNFQTALHEILISKKTIRDSIVEVDNINGLGLVPSHIRLDKTEQLLAPEMFRESRLKKALKTIEANYDFTVIDCRPTLGVLTVNALYASDLIVVPCDMSRYALEGFADLMETIDNVKNSLPHDKAGFIRILLTKYDKRKTVSNDWIMEQLKDYESLLFDTRIRHNEALNQAQMATLSIFQFSPKSSGAEDYRSLTQEFLTWGNGPAAPQL
jgi:chromosome partitioning protein